MGKPVEPVGVRVLGADAVARTDLCRSERQQLCRASAAGPRHGGDRGPRPELDRVLSPLRIHDQRGQRLPARRRPSHRRRRRRRRAGRRPAGAAPGRRRRCVGLAVAVVAGAAAVFAAGPARGAALFLATQGLALGPLLAARALTGYFAGTMRVGPRLLAAVSVAPRRRPPRARLAPDRPAVVVGGRRRSGPPRGGAGGGRGGPRGGPRRVRRPRWAPSGGPTGRCSGRCSPKEACSACSKSWPASWCCCCTSRAAGAGDVTSAALTLTHAGVYPLLFCLRLGQFPGGRRGRRAGRRPRRCQGVGAHHLAGPRPLARCWRSPCPGGVRRVRQTDPRLARRGQPGGRRGAGRLRALHGLARRLLRVRFCHQLPLRPAPGGEGAGLPAQGHGGGRRRLRPPPPCPAPVRTAPGSWGPSSPRRPPGPCSCSSELSAAGPRHGMRSAGPMARCPGAVQADHPPRPTQRSNVRWTLYSQTLVCCPRPCEPLRWASWLRRLCLCSTNRGKKRILCNLVELREAQTTRPSCGRPFAQVR